MAINIRTHATDALCEWQEGRLYADSLVKRYARIEKLSPEDRNLLNALVVGVIRHQSLLDHYISILREGKIDLEVRNVLRVGIFQILFMGIPEHAAVNETVESTRKGVRGLVNAVLRRVLREKEELLSLTETLPPAVRYSHPKWIYKRWSETFAEADVIKLLEWNQTPTTTTFRLNPLKPEARKIIQNHATATPMEGLYGYFTCDGLPPKEWMEQGYIYIQDPATRHAVELLAPKSGETILDACAAPGGKSTQIAAAMGNQGSLVCTDSNEKRLPRLLENLENQGITIAQTEPFDWTQTPPAKWHQHFDGILLDVPCSNTGVLRKRIDARWRLTPESFAELNKLQLRILENAAQCLKPEGRMIYSTCSIDEEENSQLIQRFLAKHKEFSLETETSIYPFEHGTDGAYTAILKR